MSCHRHDDRHALVRCLAFNSENIVSGSWDNTIKVWNARTGVLKSTLEGHDGRVLHLCFDENKIVRWHIRMCTICPPALTRRVLTAGEWLGRPDRAGLVGL